MKSLHVRAVFGRIVPFIRAAPGRLRSMLPRAKGTTVLIVGLLVITVIFFSLWRSTKEKLDNPQETASQAARSMTEEVGNLMVLPDEEPTVATVTDVSRLAGQAFFARAKNGDRVLFFPKERLVVLYDPTAHKIVNVGSVTTGTDSAKMVEGMR